MRNPLVDQLLAIMEHDGVSQPALARMAELSPHTIRDWVDDRSRNPTVATLDKALRALGYRLTIEKSG